MRRLNRPLKHAVRLAATLAVVAFVTWIDYGKLHVNSATAAFSFLLIILALAARAGLAESILASFACMLAYNFFFLPPVGALTIADPQNWVALLVFLVTAITASQLSSSARRKAEEAAAKQRELQRMYEFSRALMLRDPERTLEIQTTQQIVDLFDVQNVCFYDALKDSLTSYAPVRNPKIEEATRQVAQSGAIWRSPDGKTTVVPIGFGGLHLGSIGVSGSPIPSDVALQAIAQLVAIAIERGRAQETENRIAAARQNEQLKSTLLDALAHEFKTPLTSIKAATSSLLPKSDLDAVGRELLTVIDEEADRLTSLVSDSIELARFGTGPVSLDRQFWSAETLITSSINQLRALFEGRQVDVTVESNLPLLELDRNLTELVIRQLIGNALKYSSSSSTIHIAAAAEENKAVISVHNAGKEIPPSEQEMLFEKFYRSADARGRISGTGMGLAIGREIVEAHGGRIWVDSAPGQGVRFSFTVPFSELPAGGSDVARKSVAV